MKINSFWIFISLLIMAFPAKGQKSVKSKGEAIMKIERNMTEAETEERVIQLAKTNAIENAFGKKLISENSTITYNSMELNEINTKTNFAENSQSIVSGEWIKAISEPEIVKYAQVNERWIKATVFGVVREFPESTVQFLSYPLSCPEKACKSDRFNDEQDVFFFFSSATDGYLTIYLEDINTKEMSRLLPYSASGQIHFKIESNKEYILFSSKNNTYNAAHIDELVFELSKENKTEFYKFITLFSTAPLNPPVLSVPTQMHQAHPKTGSENFNYWLQNERMKNKKLQVQTNTITLTR